MEEVKVIKFVFMILLFPIGSTMWAGSAMNMQRNVAEEVIPELDENMATIISMRGERKPPTVHDIFGTVPTQPVSIPPGDRSETAAEAREKFFQDKPLERPTHLSVSAPSGKFGGITVIPIPDSKLTESLSSSEESVMEASQSQSPDTGFKSDNLSDEVKDEGDMSMDDVQVNNRKLEGGSSEAAGSNLAKKLAKTFGLTKDKEKRDDDKSEVHLLSDVSRIKEDSEEDDDEKESVKK